MTYHTIIAVGNVGRDPEMRYVPSGQAVTNFSLACGRKYTNSSGVEVKETIWFRVTAWGKLGEVVAQYVKKGSKVLVEGALQATQQGNPKTFQKNDGTTGASFELTAQTVRFLDSKRDGEGSGESDESDIDDFVNGGNNGQEEDPMPAPSRAPAQPAKPSAQQRAAQAPIIPRPGMIPPPTRQTAAAPAASKVEADFPF